MGTSSACQPPGLPSHFVVPISRKIVSSIDIKPDDHILEIGPGTGSITTLMTEKAKKVTAVEIDSDLYVFDEDESETAVRHVLQSHHWR